MRNSKTIPGYLAVLLTLTCILGCGLQPDEIDNAQAPSAIFSASPVSGDAPLTVTFTNESTGIITACYWVFGDSYGSSERNPRTKA